MIINPKPRASTAIKRKKKKIASRFKPPELLV